VLEHRSSKKKFNLKSVTFGTSNTKALKMSKMSDLSLEIHQMLDEGFRPNTISCLLGVPIEWVYNIADTEKESDPWLTTNSTSATIEA
jgi:hypothetical protein